MQYQMPFISGFPREKAGILSRFLPPIPKGVVVKWLQDNVTPGSWILDPFGTSPDMAIEIVQAGYKLLISANNPIAEFILDLKSNPPSRVDLEASLAELASQTKDKERIEPHLLSIYNTRCGNCGEITSASAFIWDSELDEPIRKTINCQSCGESGEYDTNQDDKLLAQQFSRVGLQRARAIERVASINDPDRALVEEAVSTYLPRAIYALVTLINKYDSLVSGISDKYHHRSGLRRNLSGLLLSTFNQANSLWHYPTTLDRPKRLKMPPQFYEKNIWKVLVESIDRISPTEEVDTKPLPLIRDWDPYAEIPGIYLYKGKIKEVAQRLRNIDIKAVATAFPRPNQAYWTLSGLWTGWLWGREYASHFKPVLRRRRYDWSWHCTALKGALVYLNQNLNPDTRFIGIVGEADPGFMSAVLLSCKLAGFELKSIAMRSKPASSQAIWRSRKIDPPLESERAEYDIEKFASDVIRVSDQSSVNFLNIRNQPSNYLHLHTSSLIGLVKSEIIPKQITPSDAVSNIHSSFQELYANPEYYKHYGGGEYTLNSGVWWLPDQRLKRLKLTKKAVTIDDEVELYIKELLLSKPQVEYHKLIEAVYKMFPGLHTPTERYIHICLSSYAEPVNLESTLFTLKENETTANREIDIDQTRQFLQMIADRIGLKLFGSNPFILENERSVAIYEIHIVTTGVITPLLDLSQSHPERTLIVYPGSRAGLIAYKLRTNPYLDEIVKRGFRLVKFRLIRRISQDSMLSMNSLDLKLLLDPITYIEPQLPLL